MGWPGHLRRDSESSTITDSPWNSSPKSNLKTLELGASIAAENATGTPVGGWETDFKMVAFSGRRRAEGSGGDPGGVLYFCLLTRVRTRFIMALAQKVHSCASQGFLGLGHSSQKSCVFLRFYRHHATSLLVRRKHHRFCRRSGGSAFGGYLKGRMLRRMACVITPSRLSRREVTLPLLVGRGTVWLLIIDVRVRTDVALCCLQMLRHV